MSYEAKIQRLHDWLAVARLCLPDKPIYRQMIAIVYREKSLITFTARSECITYDGNMGKVEDSSWTKSTKGISLFEQFAALELILFFFFLYKTKNKIKLQNKYCIKYYIK